MLSLPRLIVVIVDRVSVGAVVGFVFVVVVVAAAVVVVELFFFGL